MFEWYGLMTTTLESIKTNYINNKNSKLFNTPINNISLSNHHLNLLNQSTLHQFIAEIICYFYYKYYITKQHGAGAIIKFYIEK